MSLAILISQNISIDYFSAIRYNYCMTEREFTTQVWAKYPNNIMFSDHNAASGSHTVMAFDPNDSNQANPNVGFLTRWCYATHIWQDGKVVKDNDGLFSSPTTIAAPITLTIPNIIPANGWTFSINGIPMNDYFKTESPKEELVSKCECGAHSVGSSQHSSWCPKEERSICGV